MSDAPQWIFDKESQHAVMDLGKRIIVGAELAIRSRQDDLFGHEFWTEQRELAFSQEIFEGAFCTDQCLHGSIYRIVGYCAGLKDGKLVLHIATVYRARASNEDEDVSAVYVARIGYRLIDDAAIAIEGQMISKDLYKEVAERLLFDLDAEMTPSSMKFSLGRLRKSERKKLYDKLYEIKIPDTLSLSEIQNLPKSRDTQSCKK